MVSPMFLSEAIRVGRSLVADSIHHDRQCTWIADDFVLKNGFWQRTAGPLKPDFATGSAGVGWFLARLCSAAPDVKVAAAAALRHSLSGAEEMLAGGRLGFYDGAAGVAWSAIDAGRVMRCDELIDGGIALSGHIADAARQNAGHGEPPGLWNGQAGVLAGLIALGDITEDAAFVDAAAGVGDRLIRWMSQLPAPGTRADVGWGGGASGVALTLAALYLRSKSQRAREAALAAIRLERAWLNPGVDWYGGWAEDAADARSLCAGAAGIGIARLGVWAIAPAPRLLADASAAIELIRPGPHPVSAKSSLGYGTAGEIELLLCAWTTLGEQAHLDAARRLGARVVGAAIGSTPSLFLGLAGTGLVMLRLHDPALAASPALPYS